MSKKSVILDNKISRSLINSIKEIELEIKDYNDNYWAKFTFWVYLIFTLMICLVLYTALFGNMTSTINFILAYATALNYLILYSIMNTASSLVHETGKSYKLVLKLYSCNIKRKINTRIRFKVIFYYNK